MPKTDIFMCNLQVKKHFFFFTSCQGGSNKTYLWIRSAHQFATSAPNLSCYPYILFPLTTWPHRSKFDSIGKDYSAREYSDKYYKLIWHVLMGPFPLLSFSFLCSWKTCTCWQRPTPSQRPPSLLVKPPPDMGLSDHLGKGTALW